MELTAVMFWQITSFPKCDHHVFLSHCKEDRDSLVLPLHKRLRSSRVVPWLDQEDYYYGRDSRTALRDGILRSRHIVFFVTDAMLDVARGWCVFELAFAELLELNLQTRGGRYATPFLPLFLVKHGDERLVRSVWQAVRDRGLFHDPDHDGDPVGWCESQIRKYLTREQKLCREIATLANEDAVVKSHLESIPGFFDRVTKFQPRQVRF